MNKVILRQNLNFILLFLVIMILTSAVVQAEISMEKKVSVFFSAGPRQPAFNPRWQPWIIAASYSGGIGYGLSEELALFASFENATVYNDTLSTSIYKIGKEVADRYWKINTLKLNLKYYLIGNSRFIPYVTVGTGLSFWSEHDVLNDEKLQVADKNGVIKDYSATELLLSLGGGYEWFVRDNISINIDAQLNYLTGMGADFAQILEDERSRGYGDIKFGISYFFHTEKGSATFSYEVPETKRPEDKTQLANDTDGDGVINSVDLCPNTPIAAYGKIDEYGCPSDSDADGLADYLDKCPYIYVDLTKDSTGCPPDTDGDSVPNEEDDCPDTPGGYAVDERGCPSLVSIFRRISMNVRFSQSGKGIDFKSIRTLDSVAVKLKDFPDVKIIISGYSDNSMSLEQSKAQSRIEALKIKSYIVSRKISGERIETIGIGATNFIDTNTTEAGRARNRRIEIEFIY
jgi:outer membrane protein OmpA-like peptidoglycan-associated protein/opacity protein-like surface antigen